MNNTERDNRIKELLSHRTVLLEELRRDIDYALKHDDLQFAVSWGITFTNMIQIEATIKALRDS